MLLCLGLGSALLSSLGEHVFYHLALPRIRRGNRLQYWLHTSQVRERPHRWVGMAASRGPDLDATSVLAPRESIAPSTLSRPRNRSQSPSQGKHPWGVTPHPTSSGTCPQASHWVHTTRGLLRHPKPRGQRRAVGRMRLLSPTHLQGP